jgi:hypothetical protein
MVTAETQLVTFTQGPVTAQLSASAEADAVAQFDLRRGLRVSADARAKIEGSVTGKLGSDPQGPTASAALSASIGAAARLALAAQLNVNGLWAEFCAAAEARAQIRGDITVTGKVLFDALGVDKLLPSGALVPALALLGEAQVSAGVYAEAYFAVRARARLMVGGSVIPRPDQARAAGITVKFDYGYAYIWGAGFSGDFNVDLPDAPHTVTVVADAVIDEMVRLLPPGTPKLVESLLHLVVPLAASAATAVGTALGSPQAGKTGTGPAGSGVVDALLDEVRTHGLSVALNTIVDAGMEQVTRMVNQALDSVGLTDAVRTAAQSTMTQAHVIFDALNSAQTMPEALPQLTALCDLLATFALDTPGLGGTGGIADMTEVAHALTVTAAGAAVLQQILGVDPMPGFPDASAKRIHPSGTTPTVADLVTYLAEDVGKLGDDVLAPVGWLAEVMGCAAPDLISLLWTLGEDPPNPAARTQLATDLVGRLTETLTAHLRPFIARLPDGDLKDVATFIEPLLEVIEQALVPALAVSDEREAARVRDVLDTLLTSMFGAIVVRCMNTVIRPFFGRAQTQLAELADKVDRNDPMFAGFFKAANEADVVFRISPAIVSASLHQMAAILPMAEHTAFDSAVELTTAFTLLPADSAERRAQLAHLAGTDEARISDGQLWSDLLDAAFVKSSKFALLMVPPSIEMSTMIAVDQGPLPLVTLYTDATQIALSAGKAILALQATSGAVSDIVDSLIADGHVTADELLALGTSLKKLIGTSAGLAKNVLELIKELAWPMFVTATGGLGLLSDLHAEFDAFFAGADWLVDEVTKRLDELTDALIEAMIAVAQDLGVLDTGDGEDMGSLGDAVRQRTIGAAGEPGADLLDGRVHLSHAELATMTANAAFSNAQVRAAVRTFHDRASSQATTAREAAALLLPNVAKVSEARTAIETRLSTQQRDTTAPLTINIEGVDPKAPTTSVTRFHVAITGAGTSFVDGDHPLVRIEVGGWPVPIDPAAWRVGSDSVLRGWVTVIADPSLPAAHPFVSQGAVAIPPQDTPSSASVVAALGAVTAESADLSAVHQLTAQVGATGTAGGDPAQFLARPASRVPAAAPLTREMFLPPVLSSSGVQPVQRFPGVLALERQQLIATTTDAAAIATLAGLPGSRKLGFVSATDSHTVAVVAALADQAPGASGATAAAHPLSVVARARPGYAPVTAAVSAVPKEGQGEGTPTAHAKPVWFILGGLPDKTEPDPVNAATFVDEVGVYPTGLADGESRVVTVVMHNAGTTTWTTAGGYKLGSVHPRDSRFIDLPAGVSVAPTQDAHFSVQIDAPPVTGVDLGWQMVQLGVDRDWFGDITPQHHVAWLFNSAACTAQLQVPTTIPRGNTVAVQVTMKNNGTTTWTSGTGYHLGAVGYDFGAARHELTKDVAPGASIDFEFTISAPPAAAAFEWQMLQFSDHWFGQHSPRVTITPAEPAACAGLRADIAALKADIADLQKDLKIAAPQDKHAIVAQIDKDQAQVTQKQNQATALGCQL